MFELQNVNIIELQKQFIDTLRKESTESEDTISYVIDTAILKAVSSLQ